MSNSDPKREAAQWIKMTRTPEAELSDELFDAGFELNIWAHDEPEHAWKVIIKIIEALDLEELRSGSGDARMIASNLAAGPLESLLNNHGARFISQLQEQAKADSRFAWVLSGVWPSQIAEPVWTKVRQLAGDKSL